MNRAAREERWQTHIARWRASCLTQRDYCQRHGLARATFGYWKRRLRDQATALTPSYSNVDLVAVDMVPAAAETPMRIVTRNGTAVELGVAFSGAALREVIRALDDVFSSR